MRPILHFLGKFLRDSFYLFQRCISYICWFGWNFILRPLAFIFAHLFAFCTILVPAVAGVLWHLLKRVVLQASLRLMEAWKWLKLLFYTPKLLSMSMPRTPIHELLAKHLLKGLKPREQEILDEWVQQSPANAAVLEELQDPERMARAIEGLEQLDAETAWKDMQDRYPELQNLNYGGR